MHARVQDPAFVGCRGAADLGTPVEIVITYRRSLAEACAFPTSSTGQQWDEHILDFRARPLCMLLSLQPTSLHVHPLN